MTSDQTITRYLISGRYVETDRVGITERSVRMIKHWLACMIVPHGQVTGLVLKDIYLRKWGIIEIVFDHYLM